MSEWKPISSAPKDGTYFLGWDGYCMGVYEWSYDQDGKTWFVILGLPSTSQLTHWMPLPPPPGSEGEAG